MKILNLLIISSIGIGNVASAQTACPGGVAAGSAQCGPSPASHGVNPAPAAPQIRYVPTGKWITTWGAIAFGSNNMGDVGVAVGKLSRDEAKKDAIAKCESTAAGSCELSLAYRNQCAAIAWASEQGREVGGAAYNAAGPDKEEVAARAIAGCSKFRNGGECKIVYADCSLPIFKEF